VKPGSPPDLKTSPLSLYSTKIKFRSPLGGLNLTFFTPSAGGSIMVFIGGVRWYSSRKLGTWGPLIRPTGQATWPGGQVSSLHRLWALDTLSTASAGHVDKTVFGIAPTHGQLTKVMWSASHNLA
jgi:hypothetical protein